jgi:hypothetical protein
MIQVRRPSERSALIAFLFPLCQPEVRLKKPAIAFTPEILSSLIREWDLIEFFDTEKQVLIGAAGREPSGFVHLYIDENSRLAWDPHESLESALNLYLSDSDSLKAGIPLENTVMISMVEKMGFLRTGTREGVAYYELTRQSRKPVTRLARGNR